MLNQNCPYCQFPLNPGARFCTSCGRPVAPPQPVVHSCPGCGNPHPAGAKFCNRCGRSLAASTALHPPPLHPGGLHPDLHHHAAPRKGLPVLVWVTGGLAGVCLLGVLCVGAIVIGPRLLSPPPPVAHIDEPDEPFPTRTPRPAEPTRTPVVTEIIVPTVIVTEPVVVEASPTPRPDGKPFVGQLAPDFTLIDANSGEAVTLSQFTGQPVMVNFWATWCGYCEDEMPYMQSAYEQYQADGLVILALDYEETQSDVVSYGQSHGLTFYLLLDESGDIADDEYLVNGFPTSFFIYPDGTISFIQIGSMTAAELDTQLAVIMDR